MNSERGSAPAPQAAVTALKQRQGQRRSHAPGASLSGKNAAALCVIFAFLGLGIVVIAEIVAGANHERPHPAFSLLAGAATLAALAIGVYAQISQLRRWSRQVKRRLLIGLPVALLNALVVTHNVFDMYKGLAGPAPAPPTRPAVADAPLEDNALAKSGWYGELQHDGLFLVVSSFEDRSAETRRFCQRLFKPVSYATLSLINMGSPVPVVLHSLQVGLRLDSGEEIQSLPVKPLLEQKAGLNADLLKLLKVPYTLAAGAMLPDIPVCQTTNFPWAHTVAVTVSLNARTVAIPGRLMTASEKQALLNTTASSRPSGDTNITAEAWFKDL